MFKILFLHFVLRNYKFKYIVCVAGADRLVTSPGEAGRRPGESLPLVGGEACGPPRSALRLGLAGTTDGCSVVCDSPRLGASVRPPPIHFPPKTSQYYRLTR